LSFRNGNKVVPRQVVRLTFASLLASGGVFAQSTYGTITGIITDQTSAVIRAAKVEALNQETKITRSVVTDDAGRYRLVNLDPGIYTVSAIAPGFGRSEQKDVQLLAREEISISLQLAVGAAGTTVEVVGTPAVSEALTRSDSKSGDAINSLALNFRATASPSPIVIANLAPGVQSDTSGNITIAGQLPTATSFSVDGVSTQLPRYGGPTRDLFPSVEGISEFRVNTAGNSAEFSQPTDLTVISRSGTNQFHGGGYWYLQRKDFNSADQISRVIPTGDANTFGASLGGPVSIPHVYNGRDKTFFFFDYEGVRLDSNTLISTNTAPTQWRTGNFAGSGKNIIDPTNHSPFPGNVIPSDRINPIPAKAIPLFFPTPTSSDQSLASPNLVTTFPGNYTSDGFDGRLDQSFGINHRVWGRVTQKTISGIGTDAALGAGGAGDASYNPLMGPFSTASDLTNLAISYNWIIKPNLINDLRFGYTRANFSFAYPQAAQGDSIVQSLGIQGLPGSPSNGLGGLPVFYIGDFLGGQTNPYGHPRVNRNTTFEAGDNVSWTRGRHSLKFGFEFRRLSYQDNITFNLGDEYGDYFYGGNDATGFSTFLLGNIDDAVQAQNGPDGKPFGYHAGGFAQDEFRVRPNLTLTAGLRYEINTPFDDGTHQLGNFDRHFPGGRLVIQNEETSLINPLWKGAVGNTPFVTASSVGLPDTLRNTYKRNIQPRLGLSWSPGSDNKTTVRASGGIYSVPVLGAVLYSLLGVDTSYYADYGSTKFPNAFPTGAGSAAAFPGYRRANDYNLKDPRVMQWNLSVDRSVGFGSVLRASYTGSHTYNLIYSPDLNQVAPNTFGYAALVATPALRQQNLKFPNFREVLTRDNGPSARYNALTLELNRRFSRDLTFSNNYTLADNQTNALGAAPSSAIPTGGQGDNGGNVANYYNIASDVGNAYYTRRHRFVSTFVYDLPIGRGKKYFGGVSRAANLAVGGWRVTGVTLAQTGPWLTPFFPSSLSDPSGTFPSSRSVSQQRPDCVGGKTGYLSNPTTSQYFDVSAFSVPASNIGRFGNCGVGILGGPGTAAFSMSAGKTFALTERFGLRFESQFANLFNLLNKAAPNTNVASGSFGQISQSQLVEQAGPRTIQLHLRLQF
jgi:Carboxypeptidase regulatory-like domain